MSAAIYARQLKYANFQGTALLWLSRSSQLRVPQHRLASLSTATLEIRSEQGKLTKQGSFEQRNVPDALEKLKSAVISKKFEEVLEIMNNNIELQESPKALRWVLRGLTMIYDYKAAKAFLLKKMPVIGSKAVYQFINRSARASHSAEDIVEVLNAAVHAGFSSNELGNLFGCALTGLRTLREKEMYLKVKDLCAAKGLARHPAVLQVNVFELYLAEEFEKALQTGRQVLSISETSKLGSSSGDLSMQATLNPLAPYRAAFTHFCTVGNLSGVQKTAEHIRLIGLRAPPSLTALVLAHLPHFYPENMTSEWLEICRDAHMDVSLAGMTALITCLVELYPSLREDIWKRYHSDVADIKRKIQLNGHTSPFLNDKPAEFALSTRQNPFWKQLSLAVHKHDDFAAMEVLQNMRNLGLKPAYRYYVFMFESAVKSGDTDIILAARDCLANSDYPLHCAGTDLSMLEYLVSNEESPSAAAEMIQAYLFEYPLSSHDRIHLTRLSKLISTKTHDMSLAEDIVDFLRLQSDNQKYDIRCHDTVSLYQLLWLKFSSGADVKKFMETVLNDKPQLVFDEQFTIRLERFVKSQNNGEFPESLRLALKAHNESVCSSVMEQIRLLKTSFLESVLLLQ